MRVYGRVYDAVTLQPTWVEIQTDANGLNDYVYLTGMIQELKLNLGESPFYGNRGIPAAPSVVQQVAPDYYTMLMQQRYAPYFMAVAIARVPATTAAAAQIQTPQPGFISRVNPVTPAYLIKVTTNYGVQLEEKVPV